MNFRLKESEEKRPIPSAHDSYRELIKRIVASDTFSKSKRLAELFEYLCNLALDGRSSGINEQTIGKEVFGRSESYDAANDSIVRTHASRLRHKLQKYFEEQGAHEPVRITIPRGSYAPVFESLPQPKQEAAVLVGDGDPSAFDAITIPSTSLTNQAIRRYRPPFIAWTLVAILAIVVVITVCKLDTVQARVKVHPLWSHLFPQGVNSLIIPGDNGLVVWEGIMGRNISLPEFVQGKYRTSAVLMKDSAQQIATDISNRRYTSVADIEVVKGFEHLADLQMGNLEMRYARDVHPNDLRDNNAILLGAPEANPWLELFEQNMNFVFSEDREHRRYTIQNRKPAPNEPNEWLADGDHVYAVVAYLRGLNGNRNALLLGGTGTAGTECAWAFLSDDSQLLPFLKNLQRADGSVSHFELVIQGTFAEGSAMKSKVVAWRAVE